MVMTNGDHHHEKKILEAATVTIISSIQALRYSPLFTPVGSRLSCVKAQA
jgi:hypothetical protein